MFLQMLMCTIAHKGCADTLRIRESALKVDTGRKSVAALKSASVLTKAF